MKIATPSARQVIRGSAAPHAIHHSASPAAAPLASSHASHADPAIVDATAARRRRRW